LGPDAFGGVEYSVFGCGNRDWAATYQAIPNARSGILDEVPIVAWSCADVVGFSEAFPLL
jgi:hypothetical protein